MHTPTPGPWTAHGANVFAGKNCIAICNTDNDTLGRMEANARLMATAPDLLVALTAGVDLEAGDLTGAEFKAARNAWLQQALAALSAARHE